MKYWFIFNLSTSEIYGSPYLGEVSEWTNIPDGCGVIGPISDNDEAAQEAFAIPEFYRIQSGQLTAVPDIDERRAAREAANQIPPPPSLEERLTQTELILNMMMMG